ncbi:MAG: hypothetical protein FD130_228, partial [Halothiobacillaceae bacterium]
MEVVNTFHFLRPLWLLSLLPLAGLLLLYFKRQTRSHHWTKICDPHLLPHLLVQRSVRQPHWPLALLAWAWLLSTLALAGPSWQKLPQPIYRTQAAQVLIFDLSRSMEAQDLKPSRLERAKFKLLDLLKRHREGQVALIVFAAEPYIVSPLTDDARTIAALVPPLTTNLMPKQGSRPDLALEKAAQLLRQAGHLHGQIVLITDGLEPDLRSPELAATLFKHGIRTSVLAIGTEQGGPIPAAGGFVKDSAGAIVVAQLNTPQLQQVAQQGGGLYQPISSDNRDIEALLATRPTPGLDKKTEQLSRNSDLWRDEGPWLVLLILPVAALAFRRGWLASLLLIGFTLPPQPAQAFEWRDLWQTPNQQAAKLLEQNRPKEAAQQFTDPAWQGTAAYRAGDYAAAAQAFGKLDTAEGHYNQANALAKAGKLDEAVKEYTTALQHDPNHQDAQYNKQLVEKLLQQQKENRENKEEHKRQPQNSPETAKDQQQGDQQPSPEGKSQEGSQQQSDDAEQADQQQGRGSDQQESAPQDKSPAPSTDKKEDEKSAAETATAAAEQKRNDEPQRLAQQQDDKSNPGEPSDGAVATPEKSASDREQEQAVEQWLRRIPDDPGGLLRRKFQRDSQR